jgi:hypothetical protein
MPPTTNEAVSDEALHADMDERIPMHEQDLDLGREGVHGFGLKRNGLEPPVGEVVHRPWV